MFPYWLLFAIFAAGTLDQRRDSTIAQPRPLLAAAALFTAFMIGLRYEVGGDWENYERIYEELNRYDLGWAIMQQDPGYSLLNWLVGRTGAEIWVVNLACGLMFCWGLAKFARKQPNPWLALLIAIPYLVIVVAMGYTRQAVAIGFVVAGLAAIERGSILRFIAYIVLAALFHKSAIVVLPLVVLATTNQRIVILPVMAATAALLYYLLLDASIDRLMSGYIEQEYESEGAAIRVAMNIPPAILFLLLQKRFGLTEQQRKLWRNFALAALASVVLLFLLASSTAVDRLALYLIPLQMFVLARLPYVLGQPGSVSAPVALLVVGYSALIQFVWLNYAAHAGDWLPYQVYPLTG